MDELPVFTTNTFMVGTPFPSLLLIAKPDHLRKTRLSIFNHILPSCRAVCLSAGWAHYSPKNLFLTAFQIANEAS
jgi:hypothetical protein